MLLVWGMGIAQILGERISLHELMHFAYTLPYRWYHWGLRTEHRRDAKWSASHRSSYPRISEGAQPPLIVILNREARMRQTIFTDVSL